MVLALALAHRVTGYMVLAFFAEDGWWTSRILGNIEFNGALLSVAVDSPNQPPRQLRRNSSSSASVGSIHLCVHELVITQSRRGRGFVKDADADASKSSMLKPSSTARCSSVSSSTTRTLLRRELWERRFGPSQLATDACQFKSNQTTLTELAAVALVHLDNLEELERRLGASGAAYLFAYLYAYRLVRWRVEPLDPRRAH